MKRKILFSIAIIVSISTHLSYSQIGTNSPYTRFGYGELSETSANELRAMGGVSMANRSKHTINSSNPASFSSVDSLTFMFDIGANTRFSMFSDGNNKGSNTFNANLEYITMRFPLGKLIGFSAGLLPYSMVGYNFSHTDSLAIPGKENHIPYLQSYNGSGGISQVYSGLSVELFKHISLGVNAYYLFGETNNLLIQDFYNQNGYNTSIFSNQLKNNDYKLRYGVQAYHTFANKHNVTLGAIYENKKPFKGEYVAYLNADTVRQSYGFELPETFAVGLNYTYDNKLTIGADYTMQNWGDALFFNKTDSLVNRSKIALGVEYIKNPYSRISYTDLIKYRAGVSTANQYYKINGQNQPNDLIINFGVGFPMRTSKSYMNITAEYGRVGNHNLLKENYFKLTFSASINEFWFFKPKL